jgi:hypothetical protein
MGDEEQVQQIKTTAFNMAELRRLIELIPQTDPRSREYGELLQSIERFLYFANVIAEIQGVLGEDVTPMIGKPKEIVQFAPPTAEDEKFDEPDHSIAQPAEEIMREEVQQIDAAKVKSLVTKARADKKIASVKEWLMTNWGVDGFSAVPAAKYPEVLAKLKEIGVE